MKKHFIIASILLLAAACTKQAVAPAASRQNQPATTTPQQATSTAMSLPIKYNNSQYGFIFSLPADWQRLLRLYKAMAGLSVGRNGRLLKSDLWAGNLYPQPESGPRRSLMKISLLWFLPWTNGVKSSRKKSAYRPRRLGQPNLAATKRMFLPCRRGMITILASGMKKWKKLCKTIRLPDIDRIREYL